MILITGASGHIGNNLIAQAYNRFGKENIRILCRGTVPEYVKDLCAQVYKGDITDKEAVDRAVEGCEYVFHTAGVISLGTKITKALYDGNVEGTRNIVEACLKHNVKKLVYTSSVEALVTPPYDEPITEQCATLDDTVYGAYAKTKIMATEIVSEAIKKGLNVSVVYPSAVLGIRDYRGSYSLTIIKYYKSAFPLKFYFRGAYNFVDVRDVADAMLNSVDVQNSGHYILAGQKKSIKEIAKSINKAGGHKALFIKIPLFLVKGFAAIFSGLLKIFGKTSPFNLYSVSILNRNCNFDTTMARTDLNFSPRPLEETVTDTIQWIEEQKIASKKKAKR